MPVYEFECARCGGFEVLKPLASRNDTQHCHTCGAIALRLTSAPALACMPSVVRHAASVNERSRHEPRHASAAAHYHGPAGRCIGAEQGTKPKTFPGHRPWMLSH